MELHSLSLSLSFACSLSFSTLTFNYDNKRELIIAFDETRAICRTCSSLVRLLQIYINIIIYIIAVLCLRCEVLGMVWLNFLDVCVCARAPKCA